MRKAARVVSGLLWSVTAIFSVLFAFFLFEASRGGGEKDPGKKVALMIVLVMVAAIMLSVALTATGWQLTHRSHANAGNTHPPNTKDSNIRSRIIKKKTLFI
jgi:heme/copper-type cytochrome/quinol oxidase subunit 3